MSKDIRSFFQVQSKKKANPVEKENENLKRKIVISSDEESANPKKSSKSESKKTSSKSSQSRHSVNKKRRVLDDSDDEIPQKSPEKKKEVDVKNLFGSGPVKRKERPKEVKKELDKTAEDLFSNEDDDDVLLDETLLALDEKKLEETTHESPEKKKKKLEEPAHKSSEKKRKTEENGHKRSKSKSAEEQEQVTDEDRYEKKRIAAVLYQQYKNRTSVINHGCKEIPEGKPDCFKGLTFLVTGILESMERDEACQLIEKYGGRSVHSVSKKLSYMVIGEEAGPAKIAKADEFGIKKISEDELLDMIKKSNEKGIKEEPKKSKEEPKKEKTEHKSNKKVIKEEPKEIKSEVESPAKKKKESPKKIVKKDSPKKPATVTSTQPSKPAPVPTPIDPSCLAWVDKYKPTNCKQIIGQQGTSSNCHKLMNWLSKWYSNHDGKKKLTKPSPWAKNDDGAYFKAALLSGPPGVGKTTTATLVCKELGFDTVEFNASDTRSKKLLKEEVTELLSNKSLYGYMTGNEAKVSKRHVLIMDEVDGMAGNEDRGGISELILLIKESSIPIICMCNDRNHQKMRSLVNYCFDLRFNKPRMEQIKGAMMSVCFKEGIKVEPGAIEEIINGTGNDVRQTLNHLAMYSASKGTKLTTSTAKHNADIAKKDVKIGPWDVVRKVFNEEDHKTMSFNDKSDLFFNDYSLSPLFVQENYLKVMPSVPKDAVMSRVALAADALSLGDLVDKRIRSNMAWSLLPTQAVFSSVLPGEYMEGHFVGQINFPGWLGKNSKSTKRKRLAQEIHDHTRTCTSGSRLSVRMDYAPFLVNAIVGPLKAKGVEGVHEALDVIKQYRLLREDIESLLELTSWPRKKNPWEEIDGKVKAALTRAYNKEVSPYSYSVNAGVKKKRAEAADDVELLGGEEGDAPNVESDDDADDDNLENNALIKVKKPTASKADSKKGDAKKSAASTSKSSKSKKK